MSLDQAAAPGDAGPVGYVTRSVMKKVLSVGNAKPGGSHAIVRPNPTGWTVVVESKRSILVSRQQ